MQKFIVLLFGKEGLLDAKQIESKFERTWYDLDTNLCGLNEILMSSVKAR